MKITSISLKCISYRTAGFIFINAPLISLSWPGPMTLTSFWVTPKHPGTAVLVVLGLICTNSCLQDMQRGQCRVPQGGLGFLCVSLGGIPRWCRELWSLRTVVFFPAALEMCWLPGELLGDEWEKVLILFIKWEDRFLSSTFLCGSCTLICFLEQLSQPDVHFRWCFLFFNFNIPSKILFRKRCLWKPRSFFQCK